MNDQSSEDVNISPVPNEKMEINQPTKEHEKAQVALEKITDYVMSEITGASIDYSLLKELNNQAAVQYGDMTERAENLVRSTEILNLKRREIIPQLGKIDILLSKLEYLDRVVDSVDSYTIDLLKQFQALKKQSKKS